MPRPDSPPLSVTLEWLCPHAAILRLHEGPDAAYGDPFLWSMALKLHPDAAVEFKGVDSSPPHGGLAAICDALRAAGFARRLYTRIGPDGAARVVAKDL